MIKALAGKNVILGLSEENVKRLKDNQPIKINLKDMGLPDQVIYIVYGATEEALYEQFKPHFAPDAKVHGKPPTQ